MQPGEWRTLGLFAADDGIQLEQILAAMPLRIWRTDEVTPLSAHPNDPGRQGSAPHVALTEGQGGEFLVTFTLAIPAHTPADTVTATTAAEAQRAAELAEQGHLLRLWALPDQGRALGLWKAHDSAEMQAILQSLPLYAWLTVQTTPLSQHPSDPALTSTTWCEPPGQVGRPRGRASLGATSIRPAFVTVRPVTGPTTPNALVPEGALVTSRQRKC